MEWALPVMESEPIYPKGDPRFEGRRSIAELGQWDGITFAMLKSRRASAWAAELARGACWIGLEESHRMENILKVESFEIGPLENNTFLIIDP